MQANKVGEVDKVGGVDRAEIGRIVEEVVSRIASKVSIADISGLDSLTSRPAGQPGQLGLFQTIDDAVDAAARAQKQLMKVPLEKRRELIQAMRDAGESNARLLAEMAHAETGLGRVSDKLKKNLLSVKKTPGVEDLESAAFSGDRGLTLEEMAPYGVIGSITPTTNPGATIINNSIGMIAAGNAVVYNPHPSAKHVSIRAMQLLNEAIEKGGGPSNLLTSIADPTIESAQALMKHSGIRILVVTGGPHVVRVAMQSGKKVIAAGPGNPPVVVDETAEIKKAARDIVDGSSFDNNVMCQAEKEIFAVETIFTQLKEEMKNFGAYELTADQLNALAPKIFKVFGAGCAEPVLNRDFIGKNAAVLAKAIGIDLPDTVKILVAQVNPDHPLILTEQLMPILPLVPVKDVEEGIERALRAEQGRGHTAIMHSRNVEHLSEMAYRINTAIFVKNGPCYAGLGFGGEGHTTMTIGTTTGEGITSARHFTRVRRCVLVDYFRII